MNPLVTVICLCYNHERFVAESIRSVLNQSYRDIELIVVDDASTDNSASVIKDVIRDYPKVSFIQLHVNKGNCGAFNEGWRTANGDFIIDLAADDTLPSDRVAVGISEFATRDDSFGVQFGDALFINETGTRLGNHSDRFPHQGVPQGDIYLDVIRKYFICSPSMMVRRGVFTQLNGYDETLAYEDFDFWIRSSRDFKYFYTASVLVNKRILKGSMSENQFARGNRQQLSTYRVCEKILALNRSEVENAALKSRVWYEIRQSVMRMDVRLATRYHELLRRIP